MPTPETNPPSGENPSPEAAALPEPTVGSVSHPTVPQDSGETDSTGTAPEEPTPSGEEELEEPETDGGLFRDDEPEEAADARERPMPPQDPGHALPLWAAVPLDPLSRPAPGEGVDQASAGEGEVIQPAGDAEPLPLEARLFEILHTRVGATEPEMLQGMTVTGDRLEAFGIDRLVELGAVRELP